MKTEWNKALEDFAHVLKKLKKEDSNILKLELASMKLRGNSFETEEELYQGMTARLQDMTKTLQKQVEG